MNIKIQPRRIADCVAFPGGDLTDLAYIWWKNNRGHEIRIDVSFLDAEDADELRFEPPSSDCGDWRTRFVAEEVINGRTVITLEIETGW